MGLTTPLEPVRPDAASTSTRAITLARGSLAGAGDVRLDIAAASCRGRLHEVNEDAHSALDVGIPLYVVADGVGGGAMASRASRELVLGLHRSLDHRSLHAHALRGALLDADRDVARALASHTDAAGAATVALCAGVDPALSRWLVAWVGDCRAYRVHADGAGDAELLTRDDSYRHLAEEPPPGGSPDDPARMVGNGAVGIPNVVEALLGDGDMLVLMSDGVHKHVQPDDIAGVLAARSAPLVRRLSELVTLARRRGSSDDATALVVRRTRAADDAAPGSGEPEETKQETIR